MGKVIKRPETGTLQFDFRYRGVRCREQTALSDKPANRRKLEAIMAKIDAEILLGTFDYQAYFPNSPRAAQLGRATLERFKDEPESPLFSEFAETWFEEMRVQWRPSHADIIRSTLDNYLLPKFGRMEVARITKSDIYAFRSSLAKVRSRSGKPESAV